MFLTVMPETFWFPAAWQSRLTKKSLKEISVQKAAHEKKELELKIKLENLAKKLADQEFHFKVKTGKKARFSVPSAKTRLFPR